MAPVSFCFSPRWLEISSPFDHPVIVTSALALPPESEPKVLPTETAFKVAVRATSTSGCQRSSSRPGAEWRPKNATKPSTAKPRSFK